MEDDAKFLKRFKLGLLYNVLFSQLHLSNLDLILRSAFLLMFMINITEHSWTLQQLTFNLVKCYSAR